MDQNIKPRKPKSIGLDAIVCRMSDIVNNPESDSREILQAITVKMQAYAVKIDLLSNAIVIEKAIQFIDKHKSLMTQKINLIYRLIEEFRALVIDNHITQG